jgi:zeaxanthin glucosyltransferase
LVVENKMRFGILSFPGRGHLYPLTALGRELATRDREVTVFQVTDVEQLVRASGLRFHLIGGQELPLGTLRVLDDKLSRLQGPEAMNFVFERIRQNAQVVLRDASDAIRSEQIEALIVDQAEFAGGSVAEYVGVPFVTAILTLPLNLHSSFPFPGFRARSEKGAGFRGQNGAGDSRLGFVQSGIRASINRQRRTWGLETKKDFDTFDSELAQIGQIPACFDLPDRKPSSCFHYTGPFFDPARRQTDFPWQRLDPSRPLVFVSMGTLQNGVERVFRIVAEACAQFPVQTVISLGGGLAPEVFGDLPGDPVVVRYAPQLELLSRAALTIFHGGLYTALESLAHGVPMIAMPITFDQPGVGARLVWTGTGTMVPIHEVTVDRLRVEMRGILTNPTYRTNAMLLQRQVSAINGVKRAADILERVFEVHHKEVNRFDRAAPDLLPL